MFGIGEKKNRNERIPRLVGLPSPVYDMEADCFPVSENAGNKPDLPKVGGWADLMRKKKKHGR